MTNQLRLYTAMLSGVTWAVGALLEHFVHIVPCTLCLIERLCFLAITVLLLTSIIFNGYRYVRRFMLLLPLGIAFFGTAVSTFHIWLQHQPPGTVSCGPSLDYLLQTYSFINAVAYYFKAPGECSEAGFLIMGLPLSNWSLVLLIICGLCCIKLLIENWRINGQR